MFFVIRRGHQRVDVPAGHLHFGVAKQPFGGRIERLDTAELVDDDDAVHCRVDDWAPARFAPVQLIVEPHPGGQVVQHAGKLALPVNHHLADQQVQRERAAIPPLTWRPWPMILALPVDR